MATYYFPPRQRGASTSTTGSDENLVREPDGSTVVDSQNSLYIFPNPPTSEAPLSPGSSSIFSAPSSFVTSPSISSLSSPPTRTRIFFDSDSHRVIGSGFGNDAFFTSTAIATAPSTSSPVISAITPADDSVTDLDVEIWNWRDDSLRGSSDGGGSWVFARGQREVDSPGRQWQLQSIISPNEIPPRLIPRDFTVLERRAARRVSTNESTETMFKLSFSSRSPSRSRNGTPHPRSRLPLLSFFASILFLDLDDPALRLLAYESPPDDESLLFPGQLDPVVLNHSESHATKDDIFTDTEHFDRLAHREVREAEVHGLEKLFASSTELVSLRTLREGLNLTMPTPLDFSSFWRTMEEVCTRSGQAIKEVWSGVAT